MNEKIEVQKRVPEFLDGAPVNLEAAALDSLEWLRFWREYLNHNHLGERWNESRRRLSKAIVALETHLSKDEPIHHVTPKRPAYDAVAIIDPVHPELQAEERP